MARVLTKTEEAWIESLLTNWGLSKQGAPLRLYASTSAYDGQQSRGAEYTSRIPVLQFDADRIEALVYGRAPTQLLAAVPPLQVEWREVIEYRYVRQWGQVRIARVLRIAPATVSERLKAARSMIWERLQTMDDARKRRLDAGLRAVGKSHC